MTVTTDVIQQVNNLMHSGFEIPQEKLVPTATLVGDLGLDSLDAVDMLVYIEETLKVKVEGERLASVKTLQDVYLLASESLMSSSVKTEAEASQ